MRILPPSTQPPSQPTHRRHEPAPGSYQSYRQCLRWEFGFTCPFCLLHEADLVVGAEGTGLMQVEHRVPQSTDASLVNEYRNCLIACWQCNRGRSARSVLCQETDARLLDPTIDAWGTHFRSVEDHLEALPGDVDAKYTHATYHLDAPAKVRRRRDRREFLSDALKVIRLYPQLRGRLLALVKNGRGQEQVLALDYLESKDTEVRRLLRQLERYALRPADAGTVCRCADSSNLVIPEELARQAIEVDPLGS